MRQNAQGIIELQGDSDAAIVKGLIAVVFILDHRLTPQDIVNFDVRPWFSKKWRSPQHYAISFTRSGSDDWQSAPKPLHLAKRKGTAFIRLVSLPDGQCLH